MTKLSGKSAKDLESMSKDQLKQACGDSEGSRVFSQFAVQKANWEVKKKTLRSQVRSTERYQVHLHHMHSSFWVLGPVSRRFPKSFRTRKAIENLEAYDYRAVLFTYY